MRLLTFNPRGDVHSSHPPVQVAVPANPQFQHDKFWILHNVESAQQAHLLLTLNNITMKKFKDVVANLKKEGAKEVKSHVKSVTFVEKDDYTLVCLSLVEEVPGYVADDKGDYAEGETNIISMPAGAIRRTMREIEAFYGLDKEILASASIAKMILVGSEITVLCEKVQHDQTHSDPFAENGEEKQVEHDSIYHYVTNISLSSLGEKRLAKLEDKVFETGLAKLG